MVLSPKETFLYLAKRLLEHGDTFHTLESARLTADSLIYSNIGYEFAKVHVPCEVEDGNLVFAVGEVDKKKGCYPMHMDFIEGHLVPVYGLDKCVVARGYSSFFASLDYARKLLNAPDLTEHQLRLIVEGAAASRIGEEYMTDYLLQNAYHLMVYGFTFYGSEEEDDKWEINVKRLTSESVKPIIVDSCTVSSRDELIDRIKTHIGYDIPDVRNFVNNGKSGEIHTPDMVIMYTHVGSHRKMYIGPDSKKTCNDIQLKL